MATLFPRISVVVATRNRLPSLKRCVEAIRAQTYPREFMELIIVDDGSTDETLNYLTALAVQESWVKIVSQTRGWQASARNKGIALSSGELIAITDDDCTVAEDWLLSIATAMQDQDIAGMGGHVQAPGSSLIARYLDHVCSLDPALLPDGTPQILITANACFRRSALDQIGYFDEAFGESTGEDVDLSLRMRQKGMKLKFVPTCRVAHWFEPDIKIFLRRFYRYGLGVRRVFDKHHAWEHWFPQFDIRLQRLFDELIDGNVRLREFNEIEDPDLRSWFCLLAVIQRIAFLSGYLYIRSMEQFLDLQRSSNDQHYQNRSDWIPVEPIVVRKKQAEAILQALSTDQLPVRPERGQAENELKVEQNIFPPLESGKLRPWICTIINLMGIDVLLELVAAYYLPHSEPSVPDNSLSAITREVYISCQKELRDAYTKQHRDLLAQLTQQPDSPTLASIEMLCYANSIGVNRFLEWYGAMLTLDGV